MNKLKPGTGMQRGARACAVFFGLVLIFSALPGLIGAVVRLTVDPGSWSTAGSSILCTLPFFLAGLAIIAAGVLPSIARLRIGKPDVSISSSLLRIGDGFLVSYSQHFKRKADVRGAKVSLLQRECATYTSGSSSTTVTHDMPAEEFDYPARMYESGDQLAFSRRMQIPRDGMHTFKSAHNEITWLLRVKVDIAGWPDYNEVFEIQVQPSLGG